MFSMCSELTPRAHVPDNRIPQLMQPWAQVYITKMSGEAYPQVGVEKARKRQYPNVAAEPNAEGDGSEVVVLRKVSRVSIKRSVASDSGRSSTKSPLPQKKSRISEGNTGGDSGENRSYTAQCAVCKVRCHCIFYGPGIR